MTRKRIKKISANGIFNRFNFAQSYTSLILGVIVVLIVGILFVFLAKGNRNLQTSSTNEGPGTEQTADSKSNTSSTYTIKPGDDLWSISENVYNDGYKWTEISRLNKLENPGLIYAGNKLTLPKMTPIQKEIVSQTVMTQNYSITAATYKIQKGDNLWDIAVRAYGDGYKWTEISRVNNLENPDLIFSDNVLKLPR